MTSKSTKSAAKSAAKTTAKAAAKAVVKPAKQTVTVKYIRVYNNMRCGWGMPPILMYAKKPIPGQAPLARGIVSHAKSRVAPGESVWLEKDVFENLVKNRKTGVVHKGIQKFLDTKCLLIIGKSDSPDVRDYHDAPAKLEPSENDLAQSATMDVINTKDITIDVTRRIEEIELPEPKK